MIVRDERRPSRRALLAGAIGGVAALAVQTLQRPTTADAATGDIVKVGGSYEGTRTILVNPNGTGIIAVSRGGVARSGLRGESHAATGFGVIGMTSRIGESAGILGEGVATGVRGRAVGVGVEGISNGIGSGVSGVATGTGGVAGRFTAENDATMGLVVTGRASFSTSGVAQIMAGQRSVVVTPNIDLTSSSQILTTLQSDPGADSITVARAVPNTQANTFTIVLSADALSDCSVAWFVIG